MTQRVTVRIEGLDRLIARLRTEPLIAQPLRDGLNKAGFIIAGEAKKLAPVDRGQLRGSITHRVDPSPLPTYVEVGTNLGYAPFMEFGTGRRSDGPSPAGSHWPPPSALAGWAARHGLDPFLVARAIARKGGLKPRRYLRGALESQGDRAVRIIAGSLRKMERNFSGG